MERLFIGVDIGGTNLRSALVDGTGKILERRRTATLINKGRDAFCDLILSEISGLKNTAALAGTTVSAVGVGVPGLVSRGGLIRSSVNMPQLDEFNLSAYLEKQTGMPAICANDANVIALGEQRFGAGRGVDSCIVVTIGTGLGSGLILNGKLWSGSGGYAAEFGHITVNPEGYYCPCGNRGCLEQYVSAGALVRSASELIPGLSTDLLTAELIAEMARNGNAGARNAFDQLGYWLGIGLASLANTLNIQSVIIGGGVAESYDLILPSLQQSIRQRCFSQIYDGIIIEKAQLGDDAGLLGGAALAADAVA